MDVKDIVLLLSAIPTLATVYFNWRKTQTEDKASIFERQERYISRLDSNLDELEQENARLKKRIKELEIEAHSLKIENVKRRDHENGF